MQRDKTRQLDEKRSQAVVILVYSQKDTSRRTYIIMRSIGDKATRAKRGYAAVDHPKLPNCFIMEVVPLPFDREKQHNIKKKKMR
ncbi:hypothetical protein HZ326_8101 [Fusarium oxysporum f. sp. albedinis]|nr:hypothetical protein HZ326_8101 [Fusarium oxysporum f. sp. albedinis]